MEQTVFAGASRSAAADRTPFTTNLLNKVSRAPSPGL